MARSKADRQKARAAAAKRALAAKKTRQLRASQGRKIRAYQAKDPQYQATTAALKNNWTKADANFGKQIQDLLTDRNKQIGDQDVQKVVTPAVAAKAAKYSSLSLHQKRANAAARARGKKEPYKVKLLSPAVKARAAVMGLDTDAVAANTENSQYGQARSQGRRDLLEQYAARGVTDSTVYTDGRSGAKDVYETNKQNEFESIRNAAQRAIDNQRYQRQQAKAAYDQQMQQTRINEANKWQAQYNIPQLY